MPLDVQSVLNRGDDLRPEIALDPAFQLRVAFIPVVPSSGRNPDAVAYFVKPNEVPAELNGTFNEYVVLNRLISGVHRFRPTHVVAEVARRTGYKFNTCLHAESARRLGAKPGLGQTDRTTNAEFAEYVSSFKQYQYTQKWIDHLVQSCSSKEGFLATTGKNAGPNGCETDAGK